MGIQHLHLHPRSFHASPPPPPQGTSSHSRQRLRQLLRRMLLTVTVMTAFASTASHQHQQRVILSRRVPLKRVRNRNVAMLVNEREHPYKPSRSEMNKDDGGDVNIAINQKKMEDAKEEEEVERKMKRLERAVKWLFRKKEIPAKETTALPKPQDVVKTGPFCALTEDGIPVVSCAGAGIFIFWQMGALKYISTHFDMRKAKLHGGSAGAVLSTFIASGVDLDQAVRESYNIGMEARVWSRSKLEHFGLFGPLIKQWLENLLPDDAHERCSGRVRLLLTSVPNFKQQYVSEFLSREDLIAAVMASIHVPFFLNLKPLKSFRGGYYMDGTLDDFISRENSPILGCDGRAFVVDYYEDEGLQPKKLDFLRLKSHKEVLRLFARGRRYARNLDLQGGLDACLGSVRVVPAGMDSKWQTHVSPHAEAESLPLDSCGR